MQADVYPSPVSGSIIAPPSKAVSHRALISAFLANGKSVIENFLESDDTRATASALQALGGKIEQRGSTVFVQGAAPPFPSPSSPINCRLSGSTIRFLTPIASLAKGQVTLTGEGSLLKRPMQPIADALKQLGVSCKTEKGFPPVTVSGGFIEGGKCRIKGNVSSQFISGLLFAAPLARRPVELILTTKLESKPYVDITLGVLKSFGINVKAGKGYQAFSIKPQDYKPRKFIVEGDWSNAAFLLAAGVLAGEGKGVKVNGVGSKSSQGDKAIFSIIKKMGGKVSWKGSSITAKKSELRGVTIDVKDTPDLVPILSVIAFQAKGTTRIVHAERLRIKESDRLAAMASELKKMGADVTETKGGLVIRGPCQLHSARVDTYHDHRIAMSLAVAALNAKGAAFINGADCVSKSYPNFFRDLRSIGAKIQTH